MKTIPQTYFFGLLKKSNGINSRKIGPKTVVLQVAESKDSLDCEVWKYLGERMNTIDGLKKVRKELLQGINDSFKTNFTRLLIEEV